MTRRKRVAHWIADAVSAVGGTVLALAAKGAIVLGGGPLAAVAIATGLALKFSRSPVASSTVEPPGGKAGES